MKTPLSKRKRFKLGGVEFTLVKDFLGDYWKATKGRQKLSFSNPFFTYHDTILEFDGDELIKKYPNPMSYEVYFMRMVVEIIKTLENEPNRQSP